MTLVRWTATGQIARLQEFGCNLGQRPLRPRPEPRFGTSRRPGSGKSQRRPFERNGRRCLIPRDVLFLQRLDPLAVLLQIGVSGRIRALGQNIHLDLGLRTGGPHQNGGAVRQLEPQHVGAGELHGALRTGGAVHHGPVGVVLPVTTFTPEISAGDSRRFFISCAISFRPSRPGITRL